MKIKELDIDGKHYVVRELTLEEGMPLLASTSGAIDFAALIRAATTIDGVQAQAGDISMGVGMKLMPVVMELNNFNAGGAPGNE